MNAATALDERPPASRLSPSQPVRDLRGVARSSGAGQKAATLGALAEANLPVPAAIVVDLPRWPLHEDALLQLRRRTHALLSGGRVIVRASRRTPPPADVNRLDSVPDVATFDDLLTALATCWHDAPESQVVIIQRQVRSVVSGFARRAARGTMVEFTGGPIAAMAAGWIEPGHAVIRQRGADVEILATPGDASRAARVMRHLSPRLGSIDLALAGAERALGSPVVLEWAIASDDSLWVLAARPQVLAHAADSKPLHPAPERADSTRMAGGLWPRWRVTIRWQWPSQGAPRLAPA